MAKFISGMMADLRLMIPNQTLVRHIAVMVMPNRPSGLFIAKLTLNTTGIIPAYIKNFTPEHR